MEGPASAVLPEHLVEFWIDNGRPIWRFEHEGIVLEKRIVVTYRQNTTRVSYRLIAAPGPVKLRLEPAVSMRSHEGARRPADRHATSLKAVGDGVEVTATDGTGGLPALRLQARTDKAVPLTGDEGTLDVIYRDRTVARVRVARRPALAGALRADDRAGWQRAVHRLDRGAGKGCASWTPTRRWRLDDERRQRLHRAGATRRCSTGSAPSWCWPPTSSSSRRASARQTRRACTPRGTRRAPSSPATRGSPTGGATR